MNGPSILRDRAASARGGLLWSLLGTALAIALVWASGPLHAGDDDPNNSDRGGPVVVGGLPCLVEPELDDMFWAATGGSDVSLQPGWVHTTALIGPPDMSGVVLDAWGTPYGRVNSRTGYTVFGLIHKGTMVLSRPSIRLGQAELWQWVPDEYIGGSLIAQTAQATTSYPIIGNAYPVPLKGVALQQGVAAANFAVVPNPQNAHLPILRSKATASGTAMVFENRL